MCTPQSKWFGWCNWICPIIELWLWCRPAESSRCAVVWSGPSNREWATQKRHQRHWTTIRPDLLIRDSHTRSQCACRLHLHDKFAHTLDRTHMPQTRHVDLFTLCNMFRVFPNFKWHWCSRKPVWHTDAFHVSLVAAHRRATSVRASPLYARACAVCVYVCVSVCVLLRYNTHACVRVLFSGGVFVLLCVILTRFFSCRRNQDTRARSVFITHNKFDTYVRFCVAKWLEIMTAEIITEKP